MRRNPIPALPVARLAALWDRLRTSFWFVPSAMAAAAVALSFALIEVDAALSLEAVQDFGWLYAFGPEGARAVLSVIAGSMITVAGLTFSITMLTLQLAASQFGPRLLRNAMRDRGNQVVLGTFISTFVYCLLVLRAVRGTEGAGSVPHLSVAAGVLLALASLAVLIYFIHHVAVSIRIETVLDSLARETCRAVDRLYPESLGQEPPEDARMVGATGLPAGFDADAIAIRVRASGYIQRLDATLMSTAVEHDLLVRVAFRPGRFVTERDAVLLAFPPARITEIVEQALRGSIVVGSDRSPDQDVHFSLRRIVEIAQRALSPGTNDPTTALDCLDRIEEVLARLAGRRLPSPVRFDDKGRPRIVTEADSFCDLAAPALAAIARYGLGDADVTRRLLQVIDALGRVAEPADATRLMDLGDEIRCASEAELDLASDRERLRLPDDRRLRRTFTG